MCTLKIFLICSTFYSAIFAQLTPKIAIVGGGIGGTSCAYFLRQLFRDKAELTLYERDTIGGRLNVLNVDGDFYEAGGSVIHPSNKHMVDFTKLLGLSVRKPTSSRFGIYDGKQFVFEESEWHFITMAKFLWRYGISSLGLFKWVQSILSDFNRIYNLQEKEYAFTTLSGMLEWMNPSFRNMTQESLAAFLQRKSYSQLFLDELVQSINMVNYGQTNNISGFAGFVSLAGADNNLWSVEGGNKRVPEGLLAKSKANIRTGDVSEIKLMADGTYALSFYDGSSKQNLSTAHYDIVVVACPLIRNSENIKFTNFQTDFFQFQSRFHPLVTTFVQGELNPLAFDQKAVPDEILTCKSSLSFNSLSKVSPVSEIKSKSKNRVYKVFSEKPLTEEVLKQLFKHTTGLKQKEWLAYPHYEVPKQLPPFLLHRRLYYTNAVELAASAMEMSAIAGKNVALLAYNMWHHLDHKVDNYKEMHKDEL
ncbi:prenylcysteine oxidase 1-like [Uloborus diversus]|uniref:prenylcysteine oxidase 1-like n=1 Tax=Uloborus diversus TaxID=327109 RepID=UPI00240A5A20|nr:prenylcysteine oxidase 1-like [Uloborus diversus]